MLSVDGAFVIAEADVHDPMEAVLDGQMAADDGAKLVSQPCQRSNVKPGFAFDFIADFARALAHDNAVEAGPIVAFLKPIDVVECRDRKSTRLNSSHT